MTILPKYHQFRLVASQLISKNRELGLASQKLEDLTLATKTTAIKDRYNKTQILTNLAESTGLNKKEVSSVLDELAILIQRHIKKRSGGEFILPGLLKIQTIKKPATKARKGKNPFTGEETVFKAKPASTIVKIRPLKKLKDFTAS